VSDTRREEAREAAELPRGNTPSTPMAYRLSRTAPPMYCGCGSRAVMLVFDARADYLFCGRSKCRPVYAKETKR
jgi:hypothetical protein